MEEGQYTHYRMAGGITPEESNLVAKARAGIFGVSQNAEESYQTEIEPAHHKVPHYELM